MSEVQAALSSFHYGSVWGEIRTQVSPSFPNLIPLSPLVQQPLRDPQIMFDLGHALAAALHQP
jgi:hypothetical protein